MQARAFILIGETALAAVQRVFDAALAAWAAQWGVSAAQCTVSCRRGEGADGAPWNRQWRTGEAQLWMALPSGLESELQRTLFAPDGGHAPYAQARPKIAVRAAGDAHGALVQLLVRAALPTPVEVSAVTAPPDHVHAAGAGTVQVELRLGRETLRCLLDARCVAALAAVPKVHPAPLPKLDYLRVLADTALALPVEIGGATLGLGSLMSVGVGDVIRLDASIDALALVRGPDGAGLFQAYLGRRGELAAIEIANRFKNQGKTA